VSDAEFSLVCSCASSLLYQIEILTYAPLSYMKVLILILSYNSSISNPAELENLNFNVSADDDLSISVPAPQNTTANISYTCTVSPFPSNTSTSKKSGACSTNDIIRTQFAGSAMLLVLAAWAFVF